MSNLQLPLKKQWFEMTEAGIKTEDYREMTPYFCSRLILYNGKAKPVRWWSFLHNFEGCFLRKSIENNIWSGIMTFKPFDKNIMTLGYPKSTDTQRILEFEHVGIEIRTGNPEWGAEPGKYYFVIKHGKQY